LFSRMIPPLGRRVFVITLETGRWHRWCAPGAYHTEVRVPKATPSGIIRSAKCMVCPWIKYNICIKKGTLDVSKSDRFVLSSVWYMAVSSKYSQGYLKSLTAMSSQRSALSIQLSEQPAEHALHFFGLLGQFAVVLGIDQLQIPGQQQAVVQLAG